MKILVFSPYATVAPHFETELEIVENHRAAGDTVEIVACLGELANCDFNPTKDAVTCANCIGRRRHGMETLSQKTKLVRLAANVPDPTVIESQTGHVTPRSVDELLSIRVGNFDLGRAVLSSLVSLVRDPKPDLAVHAELADRLVISAFQSYRAARQHLRRFRPDRAYVFNGRFAPMRGVFRAAQELGVDCWIHERGADLGKFELYRNHLPHDIPAIEALIHQTWDSHLDPKMRIEIASRWYHDRRNRVESTWHSFVKNQTVDRLPANWSSAKRNLAIFSSSEDEFVAIGDCWRNPWFPDQSETISRICRELSGYPEFQIYLRMHPNLAQANNDSTRRMAELKFDNLTVIRPDEQVDSYALLEQSEKTLCFGSTIGIEANFWGRPSVLLGPCFYRGLGGTVQPETYEELTSTLFERLEPADATPSQQYGLWLATHGFAFQHFEPDGLFYGKFKGEVLHNRPQSRSTWRKLKRLVGIR